MKVLFDITTLASIHCAPGVQGAGIFRATEAWAHALDARVDVDFALSTSSGQFPQAVRYLNETRRFDLQKFPVAASGGGKPSTLAATHHPLLADGPVRERAEEFLRANYSPAGVYNNGDFDVFHVGWRGVTELPRHANARIVLTIFDVIALKHPEWFVAPDEVNPIGDYLTTLLTSVQPHHSIVVNTSCVRTDICQIFPHIQPSQVFVVPLGVGERYEPVDDAAVIAAVRSKYSIPDGHRYVLCVNTLEPRKNMQAAIDAYARLLARSEGEPVSLVLAGSRGWLVEDLEQRCNEMAGEGRSSIVITGYVDDDDIAALYSGASVFCYPSLDEGFGLPVLEAMRCGVPVVTSDRSALAEVAGDAAITVDPMDLEGLADALRRVLDDEALAARLVASGLQRAEVFSWERSAEKLAEVYRVIVEADERNRPVAEMAAGSVRSRSAAVDALRGAQSLEELRNLCRGQRAFILGDGVDADTAPLAMLGDEFTIATNGFHRLYPEMDWKPTLYVLTTSGLGVDAVGELNGLTGSVFVVPRDDDARFRAGPDVYGPDRSGGIDTPVFDIVGAPSLPGPERALADAIALALYLGFDSVYVVSSSVDNAWGGSGESAVAIESRLTDWHHEARVASEAAGQLILNTSASALPGVYLRADLHELLSDPSLGEFRRQDGAEVDETEVIAAMFAQGPDRRRTMVDVGAHRGTSAQFFVSDNWTIHCFEPDPSNRDHLARKFGDRDNVTIDTRAVGREEASGVSFFSSEESSGISGLSAFHESHELQALVNVTTIESVIDEYSLSQIDFLKIDVEGFDFDVLRGVPWTTMQPAVIECEYEDSKTLPMGHTWSDIAEFLRARGYSVYVSEWHPIVRYGIPHDWRRIVPYPGVEIPSNSWGNLLAFKTDPGYTAVQQAFASLVRTRVAPSPVPNVQEPIPPRALASSEVLPALAKRSEVPTMQKRPFYADAADKLRRASPFLYRLLRKARRVAGGSRSRGLVAAMLLVAVGAAVVGLVAPNDTAPATIWIIGAFLLLSMAVLWMVGRVRALGHRQASMSRSMNGLKREIVANRARAEVKFAGVSKDAIRAGRDIRRVAGQLNEVATLGESVEAMRATLHKQAAAAKLGAQGFAEARGVLTAAHATLAAAHAELAAEVARVSSQDMNSNYANANGVRMMQRRLSDADVAEISDVWLGHFGLKMSKRELKYLAHKICLDEDMCEGRMAATIQAAMMRSLALLSLRRDTIEVLEIGTLCGIAAGTLHRAAARAGRRVSLTLIDPLSGYYDGDINDAQTGVPIIRSTVENNLGVLGVVEDDYRIIERLSTDVEAVAEAGDRQYDMILIDGDHSLEGVANDFDLYGDMVRPGGLLLFDDYDTTDWPAIKPFVDEHVRNRNEWLWVAGHWRTGILQRRFGSDT